MEQLPRQQHTKEFREQAVRLVLEQQVTIPEAAMHLAMSGRTLERWVCRARACKMNCVTGYHASSREEGRFDDQARHKNGCVAG